MKPEIIVTFLLGFYFGMIAGFLLYRGWRRHSLRKAVDRCGADVAEAARLVRQMPPRESPPASPLYTWAAILQERERCAQLAESMDCAWRCRVGQEVGVTIRRQGCGPGQPDPNLRGGSV